MGAVEPWQVLDTCLRMELQHDQVTVECALTVQSLDSAPPPLVLDGRALQTMSVDVDGAPAGDRATIADRTLELALATGIHTVRTTVTAGVGVPGDKGFVSHAGLLSTNLEPQGFRRLTWFPDRPSIRSTFDVTLVGDPTVFPVMRCNGVVADRGVAEDGRAWVRYVDPVAKPSYLFAVVAGALEQRTARHRTLSGRAITLSVLAPPDLIDGADFALWAMDEVMTFDEQQGGIEHDLDESVHVAVPGYPDATEYHGLMFFDPTLLIADTRGHIDDDLLLIAANVAHEYGHHVRGNRVTVSSWGELPLKEGLTVLTAQNDFRRHMFGPSARVLDVLDLRRLQFPEEVTMPSPVLRSDVSDPTSLYTRTTYLKGAEVFGMLRTLLGADQWRLVLATFTERFDLGSASVADFVDVCVECVPAQADAIEGVARWFRLLGRPALAISVTPDSIEVRRTDSLADDPAVAIPVVVGFVGADGASIGVSIDGAPPAPQQALLVTSRRQRFHLAGGVPDMAVSTLRGYSAPVDLALDHGVEELSTLLTHDPDPCGRWWASEELMIRAIDAHRAGRTADVDHLMDALTTGLRSAIDSVDDPLLLAQLLAVPDEYMLGDRDAVIDVDGVAAGLRMLRERLGTALADPLHHLWHRWMESDRTVGTGVTAIAARMLVEPVLALLLAGGGDAESVAQRAVAHQEPTVGIRAFAQLAHIDSVDLDALMAGTLTRWQHSPRLIDRWLRAISGARRVDTIDRVRAIATGPLYDRHDRARVMAVWFPFATRNRVVFHDASGAGYQLFVDELAELLGTNAGTAVRLVGDLLQFKRFDGQRSALMRAELERLVTMPALPDFAVGILQHLLTQ